MSLGLAILLAWTVCALVAWRPIFRAMAFQLGPPKWDDVAFALCLGGMFAALGGPFVIAFLILRRLVAPHDPEAFARIIGGESRVDKIKRLEWEAEERRRHIEWLEQRTGVNS